MLRLVWRFGYNGLLIAFWPGLVNSVDLYIVLMVCCVCVASFILLLIGVAIFVAVCLLTWVVCLLFCSLGVGFVCWMFAV